MSDVAASDDVQVVNFGSPEQFRTRPRYRDGVFAPGIPPEKILGSYRLSMAIRCGIKDCVHTHDHGYLVLLPDGSETHTGWDCGLDHFGVDFLAIRKRYDRAERELPHRQSLRQRIGEVEGFRERLHVVETQKHGGNWLLQNLRAFARQYPPEVSQHLRERAGWGHIPVIAAALGAPEAVQGVAIFRLDVEHWPLHELRHKLDEFGAVDVARVPFDELMRWSGWAGALEATFAEWRSLVESGRRFFTRANLDLLPYLFQEGELRDRLMWMVTGPDAHATSVPKPEKLSVLDRLRIGLNS